MLWLKRIFNFYVNASVHVALSVVSLYLITVFYIQGSTNMDLVFFLGLGTIACYNFIKYGVEAEKYLIVARPAHKTIQVFSLVSLVGATFFFFRLPDSLWAIIVVLSLFSMLYAVPFLPRAKSLRSLGGMKVFLVALVWTGCTVVLPIIDHGEPVRPLYAFMLAQRFLLVLILLIPFEIRDLKYDAKALNTFPQRLGVAKTKTVGYRMLGLYLLLEFVGANGFHARTFLALILVLLLFFAIKKAAVKTSEYYASFWVEGIPILYWAVLALMDF